jgi:hydrogenase expression/formation protein HypC
MEVIEIDGQRARVGLGGVVRDIRLDIVHERPKVGDYVIVHAGFALHVVPPEEAKGTIELFRKMAAHDETSE